MSKEEKSAIDFFNLNGDLVEETHEFDGVEVKDYVDEKCVIRPTYVSASGLITYFDLNDGTEVSFYHNPSIIYADILFEDGIRTILFKCRQKKNLTEFINKVLYLAVFGSEYVHPDFRA